MLGLYGVMFVLHFICLFHLEFKLCNALAFYVVIAFDVVILAWANVTYFESQLTNCMDTVPVLYFWLMGQILFFYVLLWLLVCWVGRNFCCPRKQSKVNRQALIGETEQEMHAKDFAQKKNDEDPNGTDNEHVVEGTVVTTH